MEFDLPESVLEELQKAWRREWKKLTLADDFIFSRIMQNTEVCKEVLELLLKIKISRIEFPVAQKVIQTLKASKGVRMDVYVQEDDGQRVFDIEIQSVITKEEALRARYYQGMLDLDNLLKGSDYVELPQTYIIFLCMNDPFGLNLPVYEPHSYIDPNNQHPYDDKTRKIFYNGNKSKIKENTPPGFLGAGAVSQGLNRDSLKSLRHSRLSGQKAVAPYLSGAGFSQQAQRAKFLAKDGVLGDKGQDIVAPSPLPSPKWVQELAHYPLQEV